MNDRGRFQEEDKYHVYLINEEEVALCGGGDFYSDSNAEIDEETRQEAAALALKYGMEITDSHGEWQGWSEYTPDPGNVSVFHWKRA